MRPHRPTKRLGQNFLEDQAIARKIVSFAELNPADVVLEPGAGYGSLTEHLSQNARRIIAVEKDERLASFLRAKFRQNDKVLVVLGDVLAIELPPYNRIVGTPPYNISSKLIMFLLSSSFDSAHLVLQKEFANRLLAEPGTKDYGRLSITAQRRLTIVPLLQISRVAFNPSPKVDSTLLRLEPKKLEGRKLNDTLFNDLVRGLFVQRRRLLRGALTHYLELRVGRKAAIDIVTKLGLRGVRVFQMSIQQMEDLSVALESHLAESADIGQPQSLQG